MVSYQISSKTGVRHAVEADMPDNMTALSMLKGRDLPVTRCGRRLHPVNFYGPDEPVLRTRYQCACCFRDVRAQS